MTIHGLIKFLKDFIDLWQPRAISDTALVIDLRSFCFWVYLKFCSPIYGGEYAELARLIRGFVELLSKHNIKPHFIGALGDPDGLTKTNTKKARIERMIAYCANVEQFTASPDPDPASRPYKSIDIPPLLIIDTVVQVLIDGGCSVELVHTDDTFQYSVSVANKLKCPMMTTRSDYLLTDIEHGLIPLEMWDVKRGYFLSGSAEAQCEKGIILPLYTLTTFSDKFRVRKELISAFSVLVGGQGGNKDDPRGFYNFHQQLINEQKRSYAGTSRRHQVFLALLQWLRPFESSFKALNAALEEMVDISEPIQTELRKELSRFEQPSDKELVERFVSESPTGDIKKKYPTVDSSFIVVESRLIYVYKGQMEDVDELSADVVSKSIREECYKLIRHTNKDFSVNEFAREHDHVQKSVINIKIMKSDSHGQCSRQQVLHQLCEVENLQCSHEQPEASLFLLSLCFWGLHGHGVGEVHMHSMLLSALFISLCEVRFRNNGHIIGDTAPLLAGLPMDTEVCDKAIEYLQQYSYLVDHSKQCFDIGIVHSFAQWQCCLRDLSWLNELLDCPLRAVAVHHIYNGSFVYNVCSALLTGTCSLKKIEDELQQIDARLSGVLQHLRACVELHFRPKPVPGSYRLPTAPRQAKLCRKFRARPCPNLDTCRDGENCVYLHICPGLLNDTCFGPPCVLNHDILAWQPYRILRLSGVNMALPLEEILERVHRRKLS